MKNKQIYAIIMESGSYDSYNMSVISVTDDFQKGTDYVRNLNETYASMENKLIVLNNEALPKWLKENPRPIIKENELKIIPKWASGEKVTNEMRNERKMLEQENAQINRKSYEPLLQYGVKHNEFVDNWKKENLTTEEYDLSQHKDSNYWSIEEVNWL